jgi:arylsulfatase A-like enzyme
MTAMANRGVLFEYAFAPSNVTRRSMPSIATGLAPPRIRGRVSGWALRMDPRHITVAERLRAGGYHTVGLFCCEGFWERKRRLGLDRGIDDLYLRHDGKDLVAAYQERVRGRAAAAPPTFTWMHFIELHEWAGGNPDLSPERRRAYDDILAQIDRWIGEVVNATAHLPPDRQPIIIITGDHSEAFGDHGQPFHSSDLYNSQIRVPLIIAGPGVIVSRVQEPVGLADLAPTILDLAGFVAPAFPAMDGRSLADLLTGARRPDPEAGLAYSSTIVDRYVRDQRSALVVGRWKLIQQLGRFELYDVRTDPGEVRDLAPGKPESLERMKALLEARRKRDGVSPF